jgi:hypothetical protein
MSAGNPKPMTSVKTKTTRLSVRNEATLIEATKMMTNHTMSPVIMHAHATSREMASPLDTTAAVKKSVAKVNVTRPIGRPRRPPIRSVKLSSRVNTANIR